MGFQDLFEDINEGASKPSSDIVPVDQKEEPRFSVDVSKLTPQDLQVVEKYKQQIDLTHANSVSAFGADLQSSIAKFADGILEGVKTKDTGKVGENLGALLTTIKGVDLERLQEKQSFMSKIPLLKKMTNNINNAKIRLQDVTQTVDNIVVSLDTARAQLIKDINILDALYEKNVEYLHHLDLYIAAGEMKYQELSNTVLVELRSKAEQTEDMLDIQRYNDFSQMLNEMEKRMYDLKLSREIAIQTLPQIRLIQGNDKILANKIQSSILTTIPIWKNQIALTISLEKQKTALELQKKVSDTTEDLLKQNAQLLKMNSLEIARESERGIVSIETLRETHKKLLETIDESMKIYEEGRQKRQSVEKELVQLENEQKQKLLGFNARK